MQTALLEVNGLTVEFPLARGSVVALECLSFSVAKGEAVGLLGESGCGKTTLALAVLGVLPGYARVTGSIRLRGFELLGATEERLRPIRGGLVALIPQEPALALSPVLRAGEQIADVIQAHRSWPRKRCRDEAANCLRAVGFQTDLDRIFSSYPHQLSGGQRQRVAIAQAISCEPELLIADEPSTALDATTQAEILELLCRLRRERHMSLLVISHDPTVLAALADRVIVVESGKVVEDGPADLVLASPQHAYTCALLDSVPQRYALL